MHIAGHFFQVVMISSYNVFLSNNNVWKCRIEETIARLGDQVGPQGSVKQARSVCV